MVTKKKHLEIRLTLEPVMWNDAPLILVGLNDQTLYEGLINDITHIEFDDSVSLGSYRIWIKFINKTHRDTKDDKDKAIKIRDLSFFGIKDQKFVWQGIYEPIYPEEWLAQLKDKKIEAPAQLRYHNYLGWNGTWYVDFDVPIFTWIHKIQNLGWIYD